MHPLSIARCQSGSTTELQNWVPYREYSLGLWWLVWLSDRWHCFYNCPRWRRQSRPGMKNKVHTGTKNIQKIGLYVCRMTSSRRYWKIIWAQSWRWKYLYQHVDELVILGFGAGVTQYLSITSVLSVIKMVLSLRYFDNTNLKEPVH